MKRLAPSLLVFGIIISGALSLVPLKIVSADTPSLIPCGQADPNQCGFNDLITLGQDVINFLFFISVPLTAITFAYAGYLYMTAMGNSGQVNQARGILTKVMMGFIVMLSAWLLVNFIGSNLLADRNTPSGDFKSSLFKF